MERKKEECRAAKLSLLNFLSLIRDLQMSTRGSSRIFPGSPKADAISSVAKSRFYTTSTDIRG